MTGTSQALESAVEVVVRVPVDPQFVSDVLRSPDLYLGDYCGYWAYGAKIDGRWWVVEEESFVEQYYQQLRAINKPDAIDTLIEQFLAEGREEFEYAHLLDDQAVRRIVQAGCNRYGPGFQQQYDGDSLDVAVQEGLLGEHTYA